MRLGDSSAHLTYCLNVHPAETWEESFDSIKTYALKVRDAVAPGGEFGLGLRISNIASVTLQDPSRIAELKAFLAEERLYVFTINGFPYGPFHGTAVKEDVYRPDWRDDERVEYTLRLAEILAQLLPDGVSGSISTSPCSYKDWVSGEDDVALMAGNLVKCAERLAEIQAETGREIHLGLEPEPDCYLEISDEVIRFFGRPEMRSDVVRKHVGVCFDTCHLAVEFEDLGSALGRIVSAGVRVSKLQISSAVKRPADEGAAAALEGFNDEVYLHQVKRRVGDGDVEGLADLPDFLENLPGGGECRVHCHVPLYFEGNDRVESTSSELTESFFGKVLDYGVEHLEIETYTFGVLPAELQERGVVGSIVDEYKWVLKRMPGAFGDKIPETGDKGEM